MKEKIAILDTGYDSFEYETQLFSKAGYQLEIFPGEHYDRQEKMRFSRDKSGLLIRWTTIDNEFLGHTPALRAIVRYGTGYNNIDLQAASRHNVRVSNVKGYARHSVSDHAISMIYACARALPQGQKTLYAKFSAPPVSDIFEFHDKTLGIIGLGCIGGTLCQKVKPLFARVLASDPYISDERFDLLGAKKVSLETLLAESDVISIHCNLTEETTNLIDAGKFKLMRRKPILINTARGPVVNEDDLYRSIQEGKLHSAGLDVFCDEPPLSNRDALLNHPRIIATGHYAWYSIQASLELQKRAADNLLMMLRGKVPDDCLNP
jgi:D-3-phosphoglycerate dehydrogenase / 2-oxoglutarate reductase